MKSKIHPCLLFAAGVISLAAAANAAPFVWDGTDNTWTSPHWNGGVGGPTGGSNADSATINGGTVTFSGNDTFGNNATAASPVITINNGGTLASGGFFNTMWDLTLNGGTLLANGGAHPVFGAFKLSGTVTIGGSSASNISLGAGTNNNVTLGAADGGNTTFNVADVTNSAVTDLTVSTVLSTIGSASGLIKAGAGTMTLTAANTYTGNTLVNAGTLVVDGGTIAGPGIIDIGANAATPANFTLTSGSVTAGGQFVIGAHGSTGTAAINDGALQVNGTIYIGGYSEGTGTGTITQTGGTVTATGGIDFGGGGPNSGIYNLNGGTLTTPYLSKNNSGTSIINFNGGTLRTSATNANYLQGHTAANVLSGGAVIDTNGFSITIAQALLDGGGGGGLTKDGTGTLTLSGANIYTGATTVSQGKLLVNGSISSSVLTTVTAGASLGGSGTVGALTIDSGAFVTPGNSPGTLTVNGNYTQAGQYTTEIAGTAAGSGYDQIGVTGSVNISGGSLVTMFSGAGYNVGDLLFILTNDLTDAVTGTYTGFAQGETVASYGGFDWQISYVADSTGNAFTGGNDIALMAIPEPNVAALIGGFGMFGLLRRRR